MRAAIFRAIADAVASIQPSDAFPEGVQYIDLWNDQVDQICGGHAFELPAVFVEFEQIDWNQQGNGTRRGPVAVRLHIVTRAVAVHGHKDPRMAEALAVFDLIGEIVAKMQDLRGDGFAGFMNTTSATNHNHTELIENVERFVTSVQDTRGIRPVKLAPGLSVGVSTLKR